jgi:hypothetical protein
MVTISVARIDAEAPNWIAVENRGAEILREIAAEPVTFGALVSRYTSRHQLEAGKAWLHVHDFLAALNRASMLFDVPLQRQPYAGRAAYIAPDGFRVELGDLGRNARLSADPRRRNENALVTRVVPAESFRDLAAWSSHSVGLPIA